MSILIATKTINSHPVLYRYDEVNFVIMVDHWVIGFPCCVQNILLEHTISEVRLIEFLFIGWLMTNQHQNVLKMFFKFLFSNTIQNMLLEEYLAYFRKIK